MRLPAGLKATVSVALAVGMVAPAASPQDLETAVRESYPTNLTMLAETTKSAVAELFLGFSAPEGLVILVEAEGNHQADWFVENHVLSYLVGSGYQAYLKEVREIPPAPGAAAKAAADPTSLSDAMGQADTTRTVNDSLAVVEGETAKVSDEATSADPGETPDMIPAEDVEPEPRPEFVFRFRIVQFEITYPDNYRTSPLGSRKVQRRSSVSVQGHLLQGERENVVWVGNGDVERLDVVPASKLPLLEGPNFPFTQPTLQTGGLGGLVEPILVTGIVLGLIYLFYTNQN